MSQKKPQKLLFLEKALGLMAVSVLKRYSPKVIAVTGSVGKTSTKEAIFSVISGHWRVRRNEKNYNNEIGIPLTIIGVETGGDSFFGWLGVFFRWLYVMSWPQRYPEVLVLEIAADRPGDIKYLVDMIKPETGVITNISGSHLEFFGTLEGIAKEKGYLVQNLTGKGAAVLNVDNPQLLKLKDHIRSEVITYGFSQNADVRATDIAYNYSSDDEIMGLTFKLNYKGTSIPIRLNNILASHNVYAALAGISVGMEMGMNLVEIGKALENFSLPYGRMNLIKGMKNSTIIDDTYNASPASTLAAIEVFGVIKSARRIAVLGDMLELGSNTEFGHREVAKKFLTEKGDIFVAVGKRMQMAVSELKNHNTDDERILSFSSPIEAGKKLKEIIRDGDLILVKGSQGMRMEKVVEEIMSEPERASELLCRQDEKWKKKEWKEV